MKSQQVLSVLLSVVLLSPVFAQVPIPPQDKGKPIPVPKTEEQQEPEAVFRINTQLIQIDAVVTGKNGAHVDDLTEDDFELFVDGKKQSLSYFKLIRTVTNPTPVEEPKKSDKNNTTLPPSTTAIKQVAPEQVRRTVAFVVDDLGMSFQSMHFAREALKKFVAKQMQDGDLVGIIRTGKGMGAMQQFTTDRRVLSAAIEKLSWNPFSRDTMPSFGVQFGQPQQNQGESDDQFAQRQEAYERNEDFRETVFTVGTLGAVNLVVRGLRELPGRKMVILLSDGFRLFGRNRDNTQALESLRRLTDLANRSSVVIYTIDTRGLLTLMPDASANMGGMTPQQMTQQMSDASQQMFDTQDGLVALARETGGFAALNSNDINNGVTRVMKDNESYYLLGFDPDDENFDVKYRNKYHAIKVKLKRPGLQVRTRSGFYGVPETLAREAPKTREQQILHALYSPFGARDLTMQMTSFFFNSEKGGSFVRSLLHIDASKLAFADAENGEKTTKLEIVTFTFDENGKSIENHGRAFGIRLNEEEYKRVQKQGLVYQNDTPIMKPGAYQFRMVLRDPNAEKLGSAGQFINVPDLKKNRLALSGLTLTQPLSSAPNASTQPKTEVDDNIQPTPAVRRFARTGTFEYYRTYAKRGA